MSVPKHYKKILIEKYVHKILAYAKWIHAEKKRISIKVFRKAQ